MPISAVKLPKEALTDLFPDGPPGVTARKMRVAVNSLQKFGVDTQSSDYSLLPTDEYVRIDATAAALTVTLPASASNGGTEVIIKKVDATTNAVTVACLGSDLIDGAATYALTAPAQAIRLVSTGVGYDVIGTVNGPSIAL